jgi:hypothetical protein
LRIDRNAIRRRPDAAGERRNAASVGFGQPIERGAKSALNRIVV